MVKFKTLGLLYNSLQATLAETSLNISSHTARILPSCIIDRIPSAEWTNGDSSTLGPPALQ